ncbi:hypothetical protein O0I10_008730 [Lichtheimia ornata]|uniref:Survival Motor Neuron Gemin2-binding domain-containing protein n=1 Tax=Lichtheimia ornata TaxID=688661 RepID=A0AAD7XWQ7_9FUNG|nr:uncharacterized protein O0I10_008730 [Lichtheimia ornata]KAJ8655641.1 hypothetical protein O0I10_008730 [Lichtheimia ornata]
MKKATQSSGRKDEWVPVIGETIYTAGSSKNDAAWDDSELIEHWDAALEQYKRYHSELEDGGIDEDPFNHYSNMSSSASRKAATATTATTATTGKRRRTNSPKRPKSTASMPPPPPPFSIASASPHTSIPPPPLPPLPHATLSANGSPFVSNQPPYPGSSQDSDMANLIMAWYYCGYYMGYYQGSRQQG